MPRTLLAIAITFFMTMNARASSVAGGPFTGNTPSASTPDPADLQLSVTSTIHSIAPMEAVRIQTTVRNCGVTILGPLPPLTQMALLIQTPGTNEFIPMYANPLPPVLPAGMTIGSNHATFFPVLLGAKSETSLQMCVGSIWENEKKIGFYFVTPGQYKIRARYEVPLDDHPAFSDKKVVLESEPLTIEVREVGPVKNVTADQLKHAAEFVTAYAPDFTSQPAWISFLIVYFSKNQDLLPVIERIAAAGGPYTPYANFFLAKYHLTGLQDEHNKVLVEKDEAKAKQYLTALGENPDFAFAAEADFIRSRFDENPDKAKAAAMRKWFNTLEAFETEGAMNRPWKAVWRQAESAIKALNAIGDVKHD